MSFIISLFLFLAILAQPTLACSCSENIPPFLSSLDSSSRVVIARTLQVLPAPDSLEEEGDLAIFQVVEDWFPTEGTQRVEVKGGMGYDCVLPAQRFKPDSLYLLNLKQGRDKSVTQYKLFLCETPWALIRKGSLVPDKWVVEGSLDSSGYKQSIRSIDFKQKILSRMQELNPQKEGEQKSPSSHKKSLFWALGVLLLGFLVYFKIRRRPQ